MAPLETVVAVMLTEPLLPPPSPTFDELGLSVSGKTGAVSLIDG